MRVASDEKEAKALGARPAETEYRHLKSGAGFSLMLIRIKKGARHQIRVHLAEIGHPIAGDMLYGKQTDDAKIASRHLLHARKVEFIHPFSGNTVSITAPLPKDFQQILKKYF